MLTRVINSKRYAKTHPTCDESNNTDYSDVHERPPELADDGEDRAPSDGERTDTSVRGNTDADDAIGQLNEANVTKRKDSAMDDNDEIPPKRQCPDILIE